MTVSSSDALRQTFRDVAIGMVITDADGQIVQTNDAFCRLLGYDETALCGRSIASLIHADDQAVDSRVLRELLAGVRRSDVITKRFVHASGREVWGSVNLSVIREDDGTPAFIVRMTEDVTERRRMQVERDRFFDLSLDMLSIANYDGWFTHVNPAWTRCLGWTAEELTSRPLIEFVHPDDRDKVFADRKKIFPGQPMRDIENRYRCKDGSYRWLSWSVHPQVDTRQVIGVVRDITEKKRDEAERRLLEARVARAQRMEGIGTLAGGIAHDLNNVLAPILLSIEVLKDELGSDTQREVLETIEASARRGADMVRQVLSYARGVEGQRVTLSMSAVMRDVLRLVRDRLMSDVQIHTSLPEHLWTFAGDSTQIQQVMLNLLLNAKDAMPGGGAITIAARNVDLRSVDIPEPGLPPGAYLQIEVRDTGYGILTEHLDKIFDPFFTTKGIGEGSGLGLSTSHAIVRSHGGFFQVESSLGSGSIFRVSLPASQSSAAPTPDPMPTMPQGAGQCILVIDDEDSIRRLLQTTLRRAGYRVHVASNGSEGVQQFTTHQAEIALVLTDLMMPVMDGIEAIRTIRAIDATMRIVAMSGLATTERRRDALLEGASDFLAKPFSADSLLTTVRAAILSIQ
ncbi:hybrid sensor histidine kinase/response regulator [Gemmatimonas groenlandica]|uniref:histidine kinase n=1 Tax=Gemmatimonas groenlandica TaxID=2732249 RepID=A0A6M4IUZ7_9BACT|nr:PAS domain-containing hybrid sensor histidine kinase/response regulator [Gemmatimonas groenlandica]QJR37316.1 PAS domain S-box protein [Gemmatimonas groenlandica]